MKHDRDHLDELREWQENQFNPGYYTGNGKVPPFLKAKGNLYLAAAAWLLSGVLCFSFGVVLIIIMLTHFRNWINPVSTIISILVPLWGIAIISIIGGIRYLNKARLRKKLLDNQIMMHEKSWQEDRG